MLTNLGYFSLTVLNDLRVMREIEQTLKKRSTTPQITYKKKVEGHTLEVQRRLSAFNPLESPPDKNLSVGERVPHQTPVDSYDTTKISESGTP